LNRDAVQALTLANAKVCITISSGGTRADLISEDDGKPIGGIDDLAKLMSLRSFVTKEKKSTASSETREQMITAAYRLSDKQKEIDPAYVQKTLDNSFIVAAKPYQAQCANVRSHIASVKDNFATSDEYKDILIKYCQLTEKVLVDVIAAMVRGEKEKGLLEALSFDYKLPAYVRNKLVTKSLAVQKDMDLSRILFPSDPSKGLALSVKEWRSPEFVKNLGPLLVNSEIIATIIQNKELFLELIGMTAEQFANSEDPKVQRVLKTRILMVPPFQDHKRVLTLLEKQNFRGFGLPATAMDQSKDRLANLCAVPLRAYAFSVRMAETIPDFYDRIFPKGTIKAPDEKLGNYAKQAIAALDKGTACNLFPTIQGTDGAEAFMAWVTRECKLIPEGDLWRKIADALGYEAQEKALAVDDFHNEDVLPDPPRAKVDVVSKPRGKGEEAAIADFTKTIFALRAKEDKRKKQSTASSVLQRETKVFLKHVRKEHSHALADAMETYFRGFYADGIQAAAVRIAEARFDEFDDDNDIGSSGDESTDSEGED